MTPRHTRLVIMSPADTDSLIEQATDEVDLSLLEWYRALSPRERLRVASKNAAVLERLKRAAATNR